jgi:molecular chaperone DnaJ
MADKRDYYEVLEVDRTATESQISEAYRKLALECHPDRNPGDEEAVTRFKEAAEAFEVLSNLENRSRYDRFGHAGLEGPGGGAPHFHDVSDIFDAFGDLFGFGDIFGGSGGGRRVRRGADIRCQITLDLLEAAHGTAKTVTFQRHQPCKTCGGSGAKPGTQPETCAYCGGRGRVRQSTGFFSMTTDCPSCHGSGALIRSPCTSCRGTRFVAKRVTRKVDVPAGVDDQTRMRLQGEGEPNPNGGPPGDCYCFIKVKPHPFFQRHGQDLVCQIPISYSQAALGAAIEVPTLDGTEDCKIPAGTQTGTVFKLAGRGMPHPRYHARGDLLIQVHVDVPKKLSAEHEEIIRELAELEKHNVTPVRKKFFEKVKEYFHSG